MPSPHPLAIVAVEMLCTRLIPRFRSASGRRVSFLGLKKIDDVEQSFKAEVFYECVIKNGQLDDSLMVDSKSFSYPYPSATWIWFVQAGFDIDLGICTLTLVPACQFAARCVTGVSKFRYCPGPGRGSSCVS